MAQIVTLVPSANRLMESLRDIGYDLPTAIADLVDNSVEKGATRVSIDFAFEGANSWIRVADNGCGLGPDALDEALRFGTRRNYEESDLGRFGLGLKTASLSQSRCLTVATHPSDSNQVQILRWDLDHIEKTDSWDALRLKTVECRPECTSPIIGSGGTVVFWERLDRVLNYKDPSGGRAREGFARLCRDVEQHLAMVFHRFLSGEAGRSLPLEILINGNLIKPWDPFARSEQATRVIEPKTLHFVYGTEILGVKVSPYILPSEAQFSSAQSRGEAAGPKKWNRQQGFYIYRANRMIQSGGWNRLRTIDEHTKLARIAIDFAPSADAAFKINVAKMSVQLAEAIKDDLMTIATAVAKEAETVYRQGGTSKPRRPIPRAGRASSAPGDGDGGSRGPAGEGSPDDGPPGDDRPDDNRQRNTDPGNGHQGDNDPGHGDNTRPQSESLPHGVVRILREKLFGHPQLLSAILTALAELSDDFLEDESERMWPGSD